MFFEKGSGSINRMVITVFLRYEWPLFARCIPMPDQNALKMAGFGTQMGHE